MLLLVMHVGELEVLLQLRQADARGLGWRALPRRASTPLDHRQGILEERDDEHVISVATFDFCLQHFETRLVHQAWNVPSAVERVSDVLARNLRIAVPSLQQRKRILARRNANSETTSICTSSYKEGGDRRRENLAPKN